MTITLDIPDELAAQLLAAQRDPVRASLEALVLEDYRAGWLSAAQVRRLLGFGTRMEVDGFLKEHGVWLEYTLEDFRREGEATARLRKENQPR